MWNLDVPLVAFMFPFWK